MCMSSWLPVIARIPSACHIRARRVRRPCPIRETRPGAIRRWPNARVTT
jgi:hypothetical protein